MAELRVCCSLCLFGPAFLLDLERFLETKVGLDHRIRFGLPVEVWNANDSRLLTSLFGRYSQSFVSVDGAQVEAVECSVELSDVLMRQIVRFSVESINYLVALLYSIKQANDHVSFCFEGGFKREVASCGVDSIAAVINSKADLCAKLQASEGKNLVIINNVKRENLLDMANACFSFRNVRLEVAPARSTKVWRKAVVGWSDDPDTVLVSTDKVGHAHLDGVDCKFAGGAGVDTVRNAIIDALG